MALSLRHWVAGALLACAGITVALLPTRERPFEESQGWQPERTSRRQIGAALNRAYRARLFMRRRDEALAALAPAMRRSGTTPITVVVDPLRNRAIPAPRTRAIAIGLDSMASLFTAGDGGVRVGVFVTPDTGYGTPVGYIGFSGPWYVIPDATDGRTCLVVLPVSGRMSLRPASPTLGPCAFYGAFGRPGPDIARWLASVDHAVADESDWRRAPPAVGDDDIDEALRYSTWWDILQGSATLGMSLDARACAVGKLRRCRDVVDVPTWVSFRRSVMLRGLAQSSWWASRDGREWYLADLVREMGRDRFAQFWRSPLPRDSAFVAAFGVPMDQWTSHWLRQLRPRVRAGPAIRGSSIFLGLVFAGALVAGGAFYVTRREVA